MDETNGASREPWRRLRRTATTGAEIGNGGDLDRLRVGTRASDRPMASIGRVVRARSCRASASPGMGVDRRVEPDRRRLARRRDLGQWWPLTTVMFIVTPAAKLARRTRRYVRTVWVPRDEGAIPRNSP